MSADQIMNNKTNVLYIWELNIYFIHVDNDRLLFISVEIQDSTRSYKIYKMIMIFKGKLKRKFVIALANTLLCEYMLASKFPTDIDFR